MSVLHIYLQGCVEITALRAYTTYALRAVSSSTCQAIQPLDWLSLRNRKITCLSVCLLVCWSSFSGQLTGATLYCTCSGMSSCTCTVHTSRWSCTKESYYTMYYTLGCTDVKATVSGQHRAGLATMRERER